MLHTSLALRLSRIFSRASSSSLAPCDSDSQLRLSKLIKLAVEHGIEPWTAKLTASSSTTELLYNKLAGQVGIEPTTYSAMPCSFSELPSHNFKLHKLAGKAGFEPAVCNAIWHRS